MSVQDNKDTEQNILLSMCADLNQYQNPLPTEESQIHYNNQPRTY